MKSTALILALLGASSALAGAQPDPGTGTTDVNPTTPPTPIPPTQPRPAPSRPAPVAAAPLPMRAPEAPSADRPDDLSFAIGIGYTRPPGGSLDLQNPNIASVRLRLISGLTLEPSVTIANSSDTMDSGTTTTTDTTTEFGLGTLIRLPLIKHGRVDFELLGSLSFDVLKVDPDGDYNTKTTTTLNLGWGIGIGYWFSHHWQLSASATDPLATYMSVETETGPDTSMKTSSNTLGITFDPTVIVMIHLYN